MTKVKKPKGSTAEANEIKRQIAGLELGRLFGWGIRADITRRIRALNKKLATLSPKGGRRKT